MSQITIQCRLIASEETRQHLWHLMAERNTPLVNELLRRVSEHPEFPEWRQTGKLPAKLVKDLCNEIKTDPQFSGQPGRFYSSAWTLAHRIFKSWFALQQKLRNKIDRLTRYLAILQSDDELCEVSGLSIKALRQQAEQLLKQAEGELQGKKKSGKRKRGSDRPKTLLSQLYRFYDSSQDSPDKWPLIYLLKNRGSLPTKPENQKIFTRRRRKIQIQLERALARLQRTRVPKGRELSDRQWFEVLAIVTTHQPTDETQAAQWQAELLTESHNFPFPVTYETNEDLRWSRNDKGKLQVSLNGLGEHTFEIYCDNRQLHWFQRFFEDQELKKSTRQHSSSLFTLRSGRINWFCPQNKGCDSHPWNSNHLVLWCTVDTRLWSSEGTHQVRQQKADEIAKVIAGTKAKDNLSSSQEAFIRRRETTLKLLQNDFPRPSHPVHEGQPEVLLGVSFGLKKPATASVVDISTGQAITYRSIKQLLGKNYRLLNRQRQQQHRNAHLRQINQARGLDRHITESNLGEYVDRLIAQAIIELAKAYRASSIVLPKISDVRELIQAEVRSRAEAKIPGYLEGQKAYAKQYRSSIHRWSYARLSQNLSSKASQLGIVVEHAKQPHEGTSQEMAKEIAIAAYQARTITEQKD